MRDVAYGALHFSVSNVNIEKLEVGWGKATTCYLMLHYIHVIQVELEQLTTRFPGDKNKIIEKGKHGVVYRITFTPTDPDWVCYTYMYNVCTCSNTYMCIYELAPHIYGVSCLNH